MVVFLPIVQLDELRGESSVGVTVSGYADFTNRKYLDLSETQQAWRQIMIND